MPPVALTGHLSVSPLPIEDDASLARNLESRIGFVFYFCITVSERIWVSFVLKKIFKAMTAFTLLVGCYFGYVHVFAVVVRQMTATRRRRPGRNLAYQRLALEARFDRSCHCRHG